VKTDLSADRRATWQGRQTFFFEERFVCPIFCLPCRWPESEKLRAAPTSPLV
jgi:hypothetical protein